jgi:hypothetical protein
MFYPIAQRIEGFFMFVLIICKSRNLSNTKFLSEIQGEI